MSDTGRKLVLVAAAVLFYFVVLIMVWAVRPLDDSVPVGTDWAPTIAVPPEPQRLVSQPVDCNTLFDDHPRSTPLPQLTPQPADRAALAFQREPCELVHANARRLLAINTVVVIVALAVLTWLAMRTRRPDADATASALPALPVS